MDYCNTDYTISCCNSIVASVAPVAPSRGFEKVSYGQYANDTGGHSPVKQEGFKTLKLPRRSTKKSAGYDFYAPCDIYIEPGETRKVFTGIKAFMKDNEYLEIVPRSSLGIKHHIGIANTVGIIDSDYYNNEDNQGHIVVALVNNGDEPLALKAGDKFCQGIFKCYLVTNDDEPESEVRKGGVGSTGK